MAAMANFDDEASPRRLAVSENSRFVCVASSDRRVRVWDVQSGRLLHILELELPGSAVAVSANGGVIVAGTDGVRNDSSEPMKSQLVAWSLADGKPKRLWSTWQIGSTSAVALDPRGRQCYATTFYGRLHVFDLNNGGLKRALVESGNGLRDVSASPDGRTVATVGQHLKFWNLEATPIPERSISIEAHITVEQSKPFQKATNGAWGKAVSFAPDGRWTAVLGSFTSRTGHADSLGRVDPSNGKLIGSAYDGLNDASSLALSSNGKQIAFGFNAAKIEIRETESGQMIRKFDLDDFGPVRSLSFLDGGKRIAVVNLNGEKARILNADDGRIVRKLLPDG